MVAFARLSAREKMDHNLKEALDLMELQHKKYGELARTEKNRGLKEIYGLVAASRREGAVRIRAFMKDPALGMD